MSDPATDPDEAKLVRELFTAGLRYLARISASRASVRRVLLRKLMKLRPPEPDALPGEIDERPVDAAIERLAELGYVDDAAFARGRQRSLVGRGVSRLGIRHRMARQGVDRETVERAFEAVAEEIEDPEATAAAAFVRKRRLGWRRPEEARAEHHRADLARLMRQGFPADVARQALDGPPEPDEDG
ncbi:regulatory protein RecX [Geminicoccus roseus]|uniref:regulatory protein RecX n=1 Tax=Geminicoccus roseus TaxID=404900 RepID=UPI0003FA9C12|nr:regulatory protein RecX [Geminicoccus roseus]